MKLSTMLSPKHDTGCATTRCALQQTAPPNDSRETTSAPSARHAFRCRPHPPISAERSVGGGRPWRRLQPTRVAVLHCQPECACSVRVRLRHLRSKSGVPESCPYSVRRTLTVSGRRAVSSAGKSRISLDGRWPQGRGRGPRMAQKSERWRCTDARRDSGFAAISAGCIFVVSRLFFLLSHTPLRRPPPSSSSRSATGPAILSRQSSNPASCARPRVTGSSAMPLSITR